MIAVSAIGLAAGAQARVGLRPLAHIAAAPGAHIETWAYDDGCNGGIGARASLVRHWVTFAESHCGAAANKARRNCHARSRNYCYVMQYLDTDWEFKGDPAQGRLARASSGSWWLHAPSPRQGSPIFSSTFGGGYLLDQSDPAARSFFGSYVRSQYNRDDGLLMDWQSPSLSQELYYATCACKRTSEIRSNQALRSSHEQMSAALSHRNGARFVQVDNGLPPNQYLPDGFDMLEASTGVDGLSIEGEPEDYGTLDPFYANLLDQIAYISTRTSGFTVMMSRGAAGAAYQAQSRRVQEATMLLGFSPGHLVDWADLEQGAGDLAVWPEEGIYPTRPRQSMRAPRGRGCLAGTGRLCSKGGHNSLRVAGRVYRREFGACYSDGHPFGACATIINTTNQPVRIRRRWLARSYHHQITFTGGDVQSGGKLNLTGAPFQAGSTILAARDAILLAP